MLSKYEYLLEINMNLYCSEDNGNIICVKSVALAFAENIQGVYLCSLYIPTVSKQRKRQSVLRR